MAKALSYELYESWKQEYIEFLALDRITIKWVLF